MSRGKMIHEYPWFTYLVYVILHYELFFVIGFTVYEYQFDTSRSLAHKKVTVSLRVDPLGCSDHYIICMLTRREWCLQYDAVLTICTIMTLIITKVNR